MIYGTPGIHIEDDVTDRIGIRTLVLAQMWQASTWPLSMAELDAETPAAPEVPGGLLLMGRQTRRFGGGLKTSWTFEGINGDGKGVTFKQRGKSLDYNFEPGFAQVSILLHPDIVPLLEDYNGTVLDGEVTWLPTLGGAGASTGLSGGAQKPATNPMFGVETFLRVEGTYTYRYAELNLSGVQNGVGRILRGGLPGEAPVYSDRDWLKAPTLWVRRGVIYDITEIYLLSGVGGWPKPVYGGGVTEGGSNGRYLQGAGRA